MFFGPFELDYRNAGVEFSNLFSGKDLDAELGRVDFVGAVFVELLSSFLVHFTPSGRGRLCVDSRAYIACEISKNSKGNVVYCHE